MLNRKFVLLMGMAVLTLGIGASRAAAGDFTLHFNPANTWTGTAPAGSLTVELSDVAGGVQLVITSSLASGENLQAGRAIFLNIDPAESSLLPDLHIALTADTGFSTSATLDTSENGEKAGSNVEFDIALEWALTHGTKAFTSGESQTYLITCSGSVNCSNLNASDLATFYSTTGGGYGPFLAAVHVQNTPSGGEGSAWVSGTTAPPVPEPAGVALMGTFLAAAYGSLRRKLKL